MSESTPRPWSLCANGTEIIGGTAELTDECAVIADTNFWARPATEREQADAALIVRAVNGWDQLLAAARTVVAQCPECCGDGLVVTGWDNDAYENTEGPCPYCADLRAAIAQATNDQPKEGFS